MPLLSSLCCFLKLENLIKIAWFRIFYHGKNGWTSPFSSIYFLNSAGNGGFRETFVVEQTTKPPPNCWSRSLTRRPTCQVHEKAIFDCNPHLQLDVFWHPTRSAWMSQNDESRFTNLEKFIQNLIGTRFVLKSASIFLKKNMDLCRVVKKTVLPEDLRGKKHTLKSSNPSWEAYRFLTKNLAAEIVWGSLIHTPWN